MSIDRDKCYSFREFAIWGEFAIQNEKTGRSEGAKEWLIQNDIPVLFLKPGIPLIPGHAFCQRANELAKPWNEWKDWS